MQRKQPQQPPPWELFHGSRMAITNKAKRLSHEVSKAWATLLVGGTFPMLFSSLITDALNAVCRAQENPVTIEFIQDNFLAPVDDLMGGHKHILLSRIHRYIAQSKHDPSEPLKSAIKEAEAAVTEIGKANRGEEFQALQNLAVMHGFAFKLRPSNFPTSEQVCHDTLIKLIGFSGNERDTADVVRMGEKWCTHHAPTWQKKSNELSASYSLDHWLFPSGWSFKSVRKYGLFWESTHPTK